MVARLLPANGKRPTFTWQPSVDANGDAVTYDIQVASDSAFSTIHSFQDGDWEDTSTWIGGVIPDGTVDVVVGNNIVLASSIYVRHLTVDPGASLTCNSGAYLRIVSAGSLTNNGTISFDPTTIVELTGDAVLGGRRPQVVATNVPLKSVLGTGGGLSETAIRDALADAGPALSTEAFAGGARLAAPHRVTLAAMPWSPAYLSLSGASP